MKNVVSFYVLEVAPGNYFIEDIIYIYELLDSNFEKVEISTERIEFENLKEVKEYKEPIKEISIKAHNSLYGIYISVNIGSWVRIYSNVDTPLARGVVEMIADLAKKRVKPFNTKSRTLAFNMSSITMFAISVLCPIIGVSFFAGKKPIVGSLFIGFFILFMTWITYTDRKRKSTIKLIPKHEAPNFFKANSDKIIIAIIGAVIGAIFGVIIRFIIDKVSK